MSNLFPRKSADAPKPELGVNIDHVATLRQARRGEVPDPALAAREAVEGGADQITFHLREDRRHIQDRDLPAIRKAVRVPVNLEMALNPAIIRIALAYRPEKICVVPERRQELTTEGGLDVLANKEALGLWLPKMRRLKIQVSLFIDAVTSQIEAAAGLGADAVEIHTGRYADTKGRQRLKEFHRIMEAARLAHRLGLRVHAGHGLDYQNVGRIARIPAMAELNIGYAIIARSVFVGLRVAVREMKRAMQT